MAKRTHYRNGDEISLSCGCDGCSPSTINGVLCHENGCPEAWRDYKRECVECGFRFYPDQESKHSRFCSPCCWAAQVGIDCDCQSCCDARREESNEETVECE